MKIRKPKKRFGRAAVPSLLAFLLVGTILLWSQQRETRDTLSTENARLGDNSIVQKHDPQLAQHFYDMDMSKQISRTNKLVYLHIPKTGGSTIEESSLFDDHRKATGRKAAGHYRISQLMDNVHEHGLEGFVTATTVRNPVDRFVSAFYYSKHGPPSHEEHQYHKTVQRLMGDVDTVADFVKKLDETPGLWQSAKRGYIHMVPMVYWVMNDVSHSFGIDVVMCQEQWLEGIQRLLRATGATIVPTGIVQHKRFNEKQKEELDEATIASILKNYAMDACLFGYDAKYNPPNKGENKCIGSILTRDQFTKRFHWCKEHT